MCLWSCTCHLFPSGYSSICQSILPIHTCTFHHLYSMVCTLWGGIILSIRHWWIFLDLNWTCMIPAMYLLCISPLILGWKSNIWVAAWLLLIPCVSYLPGLFSLSYRYNCDLLFYFSRHILQIGVLPSTMALSYWLRFTLYLMNHLIWTSLWV